MFVRVQIQEAYTRASTRISCSIRNFAAISSRTRRERTLGRGERHDDVNLGPGAIGDRMHLPLAGDHLAATKRMSIRK